MADSDKLCRTILGVLIPPVLMYMDKKCAAEFWISLLLWIFLLAVGSIIYTFHTLGYKDLCHNILCVFLPPVTVYLRKGCKSEFWICLVLTIFIFLPGIIYAYYIAW
jgi:uncharacterized membrane protein YqaE (UPF0057 family)